MAGRSGAMVQQAAQRAQTFALSVSGEEEVLLTNREKSPMTTGGDFCPADLDGGDLEGGGRREAVGGYRGPERCCGSTGHQDVQRAGEEPGGRAPTLRGSGRGPRTLFAYGM